MLQKLINNYFLVLFSLIPISLILGSSVSLLNILLIDISFLFFLVYLKDFSFFKNKYFKYLVILYLYLIFNSIISVDPFIGLPRNLGFLRIIILFVAMNYFFNDDTFFKKVLFAWIVIIIIVLIDVIIESLTGKNMLGYGSLYGRRIVSFFKDEPIVGGYLSAFYLLIIGFLHLKFTKNLKNIVLIFSIIFLFSIFITGERSNSLKSLIGAILFYSFFNEYNVRQKLFLIISSLLILISVVFTSDFLKMRYISQIKSVFNEKIYFNHYKSGYTVFKENILFGVGNKNYRVVSCSKFQEKADQIIENYGEPTEVLGSHGEKADKLINKLPHICSTHPHQIYFELLSEHGIFGTILILFLIYKLIVSNLIFKKRYLNYIQFGSGFYIILIFLPLIPSGSFFTEFSLSLFAINLSLFFATNKKFNIFLNEK